MGVLDNMERHCADCFYRDLTGDIYPCSDCYRANQTSNADRWFGEDINMFTSSIEIQKAILNTQISILVELNRLREDVNKLKED